MKNMKGLLIGLVALLVVAGIFLIAPYNKLVTLEEEVDQQAAEIDNKLQRRADLIPNLVGTVKGFTTHEEKVMSDIANARSKMAGASDMQEKLDANDELSGALSRLLVVVENYPELKSDKQFQQLMDELAGTENRISVERGKYNEVVATYNKQMKRFPTNIAAKILGFEERPYFKADEKAGEAPTVDFGNDQ
ncbi:LemA family protein [Planococcaceae bacterium Storch 2/2-2]|nr:LemA family protein [Planococcaceae bacterium Storch 2/2-2]